MSVILIYSFLLKAGAHHTTETMHYSYTESADIVFIRCEFLLGNAILLMEEILHHLGCTKPCK